MQKTRQRANTCAIAFDFQDESGRRRLIADADIVISMLPATMHVIIAEDCLKLKRNLVTPSYISDAMLGMDEDVKKEGLIFMNEIGLDPGIDHMSALQAIARLKDEGKEITGFLSHTGGLVAPENDDNGWHYKVTWNPRNVVLAGQGEGKILYMKDGEKVELHYEDLLNIR
ncbi:MAG: saccharopine dehydrogenase NADP-binding domain-containing protein [Bacteroidetes bacterium]|nr:saccharopine dehydrogenase NADP-binding domain-containing protein [Bacteroidota bacterium]